MTRSAQVRREWKPGAGTGGVFLLGLVCLLVGTACATGRGDSMLTSQLESGEYEAAVQRFRGDSALQRQEAALYHMGLLFASPADSFYAPARADSLLGRLLELYPETRYRAVVEGVRALLDSTFARAARVDTIQEQMEALKALETGQPADTSGSSSP